MEYKTVFRREELNLQDALSFNLKLYFNKYKLSRINERKSFTPNGFF